jgi:alkaline phosphatase D
MNLFFPAYSLALLTSLPSTPAQVIGDAPQIVGPYVGNLGPHEATVFVRFLLSEPVHMSLVDPSGRIKSEQTVTPKDADDKTVRWDLRGLEPETTYGVNVLTARIFFKTPSEPDRPAKVTLAFGSCADDRPGIQNPVWPAIQKDAPDALVLLGDTPYIDSTDLAMQRRRYVEFFAGKGLASLLKNTIVYATWDDHDFAVDNADGKVAGKENSRKAFFEHHGNPTSGEDGQGIYTRFRRGPVDVFLLDTRWFSGTEPSFADASKPTLLGAKQWAWLQKELPASTAPFKVLASGLVWNDAVDPKKKDTWAGYGHERAAVFKLIAEKKIEGIVLVGGDLHRSRVLVHPTEETGIPYPVREIVASPLGGNAAKDEGVRTSAVSFDKAESYSYVLLTADSYEKPSRLTAVVKSATSGELFKIELGTQSLASNTAVVPAAREPGPAGERTNTVLARAKRGPVDLVFLGDSITEGWEAAGKDVWAERYGKRKAVALGVGGDRTQHVLWRLDHGQLDGLDPKLVVVMIGTNNSNGKEHTSEEIAQGIEAVVRSVRAKAPKAKVLLLAVFPRGEKPNEQRAKNDEASHLAADAVADGKDVVFLDISPSFLAKDGTLSKDVMPDFLHPNAKGYAIWADAIEGKVKELLGE